MKFTKANWAVVLMVALLALMFAPPKADAALHDWTPLNLQEQAAFGFTHVITIDATNCVGLATNAANSAANTLFPRLGTGTVTFPSGTRVRNAAVHLEKAFATANGATAIALNIGDSSVTNRFLSAAAIGTNAGTGVLETNLSTGVIGFNADVWLQPSAATNHMYNTGTNLTFHIAPTGDSVPNLTSGRLRIFLNVADVFRLEGL